MAKISSEVTFKFEDRYKEIQELIEDGQPIEYGDSEAEELYELMEGVYKKDPSIVKGMNGWLSEFRNEFKRIRTLVAYGGQIYTLNKTKPFDTFKIQGVGYDSLTQNILEQIDDQLEDMSTQLRDQIEYSFGVNLSFEVIPMVDPWYFDVIYGNFVERKLEENDNVEIPTVMEPKSKWMEYLSNMG